MDPVPGWPFFPEELVFACLLLQTLRGADDNSLYEPTTINLAGLYARRIAGGHRHYRHSRSDALAGPSSCEN
jgi:hypothetical protein